MNSDDLSLFELGNRLETAIAVEAGLIRRTRSGPAPTRKRRLVVMAAAAFVLGIVAVAISMRPASHEQITTLRTPAGPVVQVPVKSTPAWTTPYGLSAEQFAQEVFAHLPPAVDSRVACTGSGPLRYSCTIASGLTRPLQDHGTMRVLFVDRNRILGGACVSRDQSQSKWDCSLAEAAVGDGLLSSNELTLLHSDG